MTAGYGGVVKPMARWIWSGYGQMGRAKANFIDPEQGFQNPDVENGDVQRVPEGRFVGEQRSERVEVFRTQQGERGGIAHPDEMFPAVHRGQQFFGKTDRQKFQELFGADPGPAAKQALGVEST